MAQTYGVEAASSVEALLADQRIQVVVNLTSPEAHEAVNYQILDAGKHLFSEKPFAQSYKEAVAIRDYAQARNLFCAGAPDTYLAAPLKTCKKIIEDNWIGKIVAANINALSHGVEHWHANARAFYQASSGPLKDMSQYYISALCFFMGEVESVLAMSTRSSDKRVIRNDFSHQDVIPVETDTHYAVLLKMREGCVVTMNISFDVWHSEAPIFEIYGTDGMLSVPDPNFTSGEPKVFRKESALSKQFYPEGEAKAYAFPLIEEVSSYYTRAYGVYELARAIRGEGSESVNFNMELILHTLEVIDKVYLAIKTQTLQTIDSRLLK